MRIEALESTVLIEKISGSRDCGKPREIIIWIIKDGDVNEYHK